MTHPIPRRMAGALLAALAAPGLATRAPAQEAGHKVGSVSAPPAARCAPIHPDTPATSNIARKAL